MALNPSPDTERAIRDHYATHRDLAHVFAIGHRRGGYGRDEVRIICGVAIRTRDPTA